MAGDAKPKKMLIGGIVIMVIATIAGIAAFAVGLSKGAGVVDQITNSDSIDLPGTETVAGTDSQFTVWSTGSFVNCTVNDGEVTFDTSASTDQSTEVNGENFDLVGWFDTTNGQDYAVNCDGPVGDTFSVIEISFSELGWAVGLIFGSFIGGFGLFVIGLIFVIIALFRRSSWTKRQGIGPGSYQPPPGQQPWTAPQGQAPQQGYGAPAPGQGSPPPPGAQPPSPGSPPPAPGGPPSAQPPPPPGGTPPPPPSEGG